MTIRTRGLGFLVDVVRNGKRYRRKASSRVEAEEMEATLRLHLLRGTEPPQEGTTSDLLNLSGLVDSTLRRYAGRKSLDGAERVLGELVSYFGADCDPRTITEQRIQELVNHWLGRGYKTSTINWKLSKLSMCIKEGQALGCLTTIPRIPRLPQTPGRTRVLTPEEETRLVSSASGLLACCLRVLVETGLRRGEILGLEWRDVDDDCLTVRRGKTGARVVPLTRAAREALSEVCPVGRGPFSSLSISALQRGFTDAKIKAGIADREVVLHTLRHTCATRLLRGGTDIATVAKWLGHTSSATTCRYVHASISTLQGAAHTLERQRYDQQGIGTRFC